MRERENTNPHGEDEVAIERGARASVELAQAHHDICIDTQVRMREREKARRLPAEREERDERESKEAEARTLIGHCEIEGRVVIADRPGAE
jgi:hypothetical protein